VLCGTAGLEKGVHLLDGLAGSADKTDAFVMVLSLPVKKILSGRSFSTKRRGHEKRETTTESGNP